MSRRSRRLSRPSARRFRDEGLDPETYRVVLPPSVTPATPPPRKFMADAPHEYADNTPDDELRRLVNGEEAQPGTALSVLPDPRTPFPPRPERPDPDHRGEAQSVLPQLRGPHVDIDAERARHALWFHARLSPLYAAKIAGCAVRGLGRLLVGAGVWVRDTERLAAAQEEYAKGRTEQALRAWDAHDKAVRRRAALAVPPIVGLVAAPVPIVYGLDTPYWELAAFAGAAEILFLAWFGRPTDRRMFPSSVTTPARRPITDLLLRDAFADAGLVTKDRAIDFAEPVQRVKGQVKGWETVIVLPGNKTAIDAIKNRVGIAAGLDVDESRVFLERVRGDQGSARRVRVFVADRDPMSGPPVVTPLTRLKTLDIFKPFPFGRDARGNEIRLPLVYLNALFGGLPGSGKTFTVRLIGAAAALDPTVRLMVFDGKGGADWLLFEKVAHRIGIGDRDAVCKLLLQTLKQVWDEEIPERYLKLQDLARKKVIRESKVTPAVARNPALGLPITVLIIDEVQDYLDSPWGNEINELLIKITRKARALGIQVILATQRPDADTIDPRLRANCHIRGSNRVADTTSAKMILGELGDSPVRPTDILPHQLGTIVLRGVSDDSADARFDDMFVRPNYMNDEHLEGILDVSHEVRSGKEGGLTGAAIGEQVIEEDTPPTLLEDVLTVFRPGEDAAWSANLVTRLAELKPNTYSGWTVRQLGANLKSLGVRTKDLWSRPDAGGEATTARGVDLRAVQVAQADRILDSSNDDEPGEEAY